MAKVVIERSGSEDERIESDTVIVHVHGSDQKKDAAGALGAKVVSSKALSVSLAVYLILIMIDTLVEIYTALLIRANSP